MSRARPWHTPLQRYVRLCYTSDRGAGRLGTPEYEPVWERICAETDALLNAFTPGEQQAVHDFHAWYQRQFPPLTPEELQHRAELMVQSEWLS